MGETAGRMNRQERVLPPVSGGQQQPEELHENIEETRAEMGETIDAIEERLSPQRLKEEAKHMAREQTVGRAEQMVSGAQDKAQHAVSGAQQTAKSTGSGIVHTVKQNPMPAALIGVGLGWMIMESRGSSSQQHQSGQSHSSMGQLQQKASQVTSEAEHRAGQMAGQAQHLAHEAQHEVGHLTGQARQRVQQTRSQFDRLLHENPAAVGAVALGLGAAVGLAIPETRKEDQLMGDTRDTMMHKAEQKAQDTMHKAEHVAEEAAKSAKSTAQQEAQKQHLTG